ncbi:STAS domain-containing protein [Streptomyces alboviridis]|uniref:STAS domain-containing protein n=1 Tax=Streptomyces alboviridis TaxID=67269 RepID=UPI00068EA86D|nr:STAS domain-containing protein [Streptomyces alboviridis]
MSGLAAGEAVLRTVHPWFTGIEGPMTKSPAVSSVAHQLGCGARVLSRLLDLGGDRITFGDSTFLRLIMTTHQEADLRIAAPSPAITRLISIVGADQVLNIHPTVEAARSA